MSLTAVKARNINRPGLHSDEKNLYLKVTPKGTKSWIFRYTRNNKVTNMGLGAYPDVSLAEARELASNNRKLLRNFQDPLTEKNKRKRLMYAEADNFAETMENYINAKSSGWTEKHTKQFRNTLKTYALPFLESVPIDKVSTQEVLQVLRPIWETKNETASRVRGRIEMVLDYATATGLYQGENPARWKGHLSHLLAKRSSVGPVTHMPAMPYPDMYEFMKELRSRKGMSRSALELCILTATRIGSVVGAKWSEFEGDVWTIPGDRMKGDTGEFKIPLSEATKSLLSELPRVDGSDYLFPSKNGTHLNFESPRKLLQKDLGYKQFTVHGFRSTFRDWSAELTDYPNHICEMALAHAIGSGVEKAYRRGDLFKKRANLMNDWAKFLTKKPAVVVQINPPAETTSLASQS